LEFIVLDTGDGILLKPKYPFPPTSFQEAAGRLAFGGEPKSLQEMEAAIERAVREEWHVQRWHQHRGSLSGEG
jgi:hypothetical protein